MIYRYLSILLGAALVVSGLQIPGFVNQYEQRVSAHLIEIRNNLEGFQKIADRYHGGSLAALIDQHLASPDPTFHAEGDVIEGMWRRQQRFEAEFRSLQTSLTGRLAHVTLAPDRELFQETMANYTYVITLNTDAVACAIAVLFIGVIIADLLHFLILLPFSRSQRRRARPTTAGKSD